jgi:GNAT superfamily N-acetyltransferase
MALDVWTFNGDASAFYRRAGFVPSHERLWAATEAVAVEDAEGSRTSARVPNVIDVRLVVNAPANNAELNALFSASWPQHVADDVGPVLALSLSYICAYRGDRLVGFVNIAWNGREHAFLLDPTVHPDFRRRGIGTRLVEKAVAVARERGVEWLHVDYVAALEPFYRRCGFRSTSAGVMRIAGDTR